MVFTIPYLQRKQAQRGDTLVEVVVAMALFTVVLVGAYAVASLSVRVGIQARERTQAVWLAQQQAERLLAKRDKLLRENQEPPAPDGTGVNIFGVGSPGDFPLSTPYTLGPDLSRVSGVASAGIFNVQVTSQPQNRYRGGANPDQLNATVQVQWNSAVGSATNSLNVTVTLADTRTNTVRDCSVKGDPLCVR